MHLFSNVNYHLSSSLGLDDQNALAKLLDSNGAVQVTLQEATHIITDSLEFEGWQSVGEHVAVVTVSPTYILSGVSNLDICADKMGRTIDSPR